MTRLGPGGYGPLRLVPITVMKVTKVTVIGETTFASPLVLLLFIYAGRLGGGEYVK